MTAHNIFTTLPTPGAISPVPLSARVEVENTKNKGDFKEGGENEAGNKPNEGDEGEYLEVHF